MTLPSLPVDENGLYIWITALAAAHIVAAYAIRWRADKKLFSDPSQKALISTVFDAITFSGSVMLLLGVLNEGVLRAIGSVKPYLLFAGIAGAVYALHALVPRD